jgi:hypothetical protein
LNKNCLPCISFCDYNQKALSGDKYGKNKGNC